MLSDPFGIGQKACAEIQLQIAEKIMADAARYAFATGWVDPDWRAMCRRMFALGREQYEAAKAAMNGGTANGLG